MTTTAVLARLVLLTALVLASSSTGFAKGGGSAPPSPRNGATGKHADRQQAKPQASPSAQKPSSQGAHDHGKNGTPQELPPFIPLLTDEDRKAAFPDVDGHAVHDNEVHHFVLADQVEWQSIDGGGLNLDTSGWIGRDRDRLWFRVEGDSDDGDVAKPRCTPCTAGCFHAGGMS